MKLAKNDPERFSLNKSQQKNLAMNNLNDTILEKGKFYNVIR